MFANLKGRRHGRKPEACATASTDQVPHERDELLPSVHESDGVGQSPHNPDQREYEDHVESELLGSRELGSGDGGPEKCCIGGRRGVPRDHFGGADGAVVLAIRRRRPHTERARRRSPVRAKGRGLRQGGGGRWGMEQSGFAQIGAKGLAAFWLGA